MRIIASAVIASTLLATASAGNAVVLYASNYNSLTPALTVTSLPGWTVTGNVDLVATGTFGITCSVVCVDLDGTNGPGAILSDPIGFAAGKRVTVSFDISGNQRGSADDLFIASVSFAPANGGIANSISGPAGFTTFGPGGFLDMLNGTPYNETIASGRSFLTYSYSFTANTAGTFQLGFATTSSDFQGPILDNVLVSQVPEPASWAMLITGFAMVGFAARRRRVAVAA